MNGNDVVQILPVSVDVNAGPFDNISVENIELTSMPAPDWMAETTVCKSVPVKVITTVPMNKSVI